MSEHNKDHCVDCGKHRSELEETPWGAFLSSGEFGIRCRPCRQKRVDKQIAEFQAKGAATEYTDDITCPNCGYENGDSWEVSEDSGEDTCGNCGCEFEFERHIEVTYSTTQKVNP